jgi:adenylylsulfate kinase
VSETERARYLGQKGAVVWLTGLSGSGKSTLARALEAALVREGRFVAVLDGDNLRHGLNRDLGFSPADRAENIRRAGEVAALCARNNVVVVTAFISPFRADRRAARQLLPPGRFLEVHCAATLAQCERRDPKGLYRKARAGEVKEFTGLSSPYEPPRRPELVLPTGSEPIAASVRSLRSFLARRGIV